MGEAFGKIYAAEYSYFGLWHMGVMGSAKVMSCQNGSAK